jgi:hypothetical protein
VGAHYPHDVVAGLALGAGVVVLGQLLARPILVWLLARLVRTPLRPLLVAGGREPEPTPTAAGTAGRPAGPTAPREARPAGSADVQHDAAG